MPTTNGLWLTVLLIVSAGANAAVTVKFTGPEPAPAAICVVVTPLTLLGFVPTVVLVTWISTVQPPGATLGTVRFNALAPAAPTTSAGEFVTLAQVPPIAAEATLILVSVSVKLALSSMPVLVLPSVKRIVLMPPLLILGCKKALEIVTGVSGGGVTIKLADAVVLVLALVEVTVPVVLVMPGEAATTVLVTATLMLQPPVPLALNGTVMPVMLSDVSLAMFPATTVPPQLLMKFGFKNTFMPDGKISLHAAPVMACVVEGLLIVNVIVVALLATMVDGLKVFVTVGAARRTANGAVAATVLLPPSSVVKAATGMVLV